MTDNSIGIWFAEDYDEEDCWNCGGEGYVYGCSWDWQCDTWDGDSCLCTRPCHICYPPKLDPELRRVLGEALAAPPDPCLKPGCGHARGTVCTHTLCHGRGYGQHLYAQVGTHPQGGETDDDR